MLVGTIRDSWRWSKGPVSHPRQVNSEDGAGAQLALHANASAALFDDSIDRRQPQAGPLAYFLCREERIENVWLDALVDTASRVAHRKHHVCSGRTIE